MQAASAVDLGFDASRVEKLHELFDHYDVDKSGTLEADELECLVVELGHDADHESARALLQEFGDVSRGEVADEQQQRAVSFDAFLRLVAKFESAAEFSAGESASSVRLMFRRFSLSSRLGFSSGSHDEDETNEEGASLL